MIYDSKAVVQNHHSGLCIVEFSRYRSRRQSGQPHPMGAETVRENVGFVTGNADIFVLHPGSIAKEINLHSHAAAGGMLQMQHLFAEAGHEEWIADFAGL